jgi:hypothetical protein
MNISKKPHYINSPEWSELCRISGNFSPVSGKVEDVAEAVRHGADLRRFSTYDPDSTGLVEETMTLQTTWVFDNDHVGGLATLRQPVYCALDFAEGPSLACWIFNVAAPSGMAMVPLDGQPVKDATGKWAKVENHPFTKGDDTQWLSKEYRWWARDNWQEIYAHDEQGESLRGVWQDVREAANTGRVLKVGIRNLWAHLSPDAESAPDHEVFIECGVQFAHVDAGFFGALTIPTFLVKPRIPLQFSKESFTPGWVLVRTDGRVCRQTLDPATMRWQRDWTRHAIRWFAR